MMTNTNYFSSVKDIISDIANGKMVIIVDNDASDCYGSLAQASHFVTPSSCDFFQQYGDGQLRCTLSKDRVENMRFTQEILQNNNKQKTPLFSLGLKTLQTEKNRSKRQAKIIYSLLHSNENDVNLSSSGDIIPICTLPMGVLRRAGHEEAVSDLARFAELQSSGVLTTLKGKKGGPVSLSSIIQFSKKHHIKIVTISSLIKYRRHYERFITLSDKKKINTEFGRFDCYSYFDVLNEKVHFAIVKGPIKKAPILVRVHSECLTGDVFLSKRCDCGNQLQAAMKAIQDRGSGIVLYMRQEGRGIGLENKIKAYKFQEKGLDTVQANLKLGFDADLRDYGVGAQILLDLQVKTIDLMTNNPRKIVGLEGYGIVIKNRIPIIVDSCEHNEKYLQVKNQKLGHLFPRI